MTTISDAIHGAVAVRLIDFAVQPGIDGAGRICPARPVTNRPSLPFRLAAILLATMLVGLAPAGHSRPAATGGSLTFESARRESQLVLATPDRSIEALMLQKQTSVRPGGLPFVPASRIPEAWRATPHRIVLRAGRTDFRRNPPLVGTVELRI